MATYGQQLRQGLPRVAGGDPWPPSGTSPLEGAPAPTVAPEVAPAEVVTEVAATVVPEAPAPAATLAHSAAPVAAVASGPVRRGLPRVPGGEPWPPASTAPAPAPAAVAQAAPAPSAVESAAAEAAAPAPAPAPVAVAAAATVAASDLALRRGLPRVPGGEPWPPAGLAPQAAPAVVESVAVAVAETTPASTTVAKPTVDLSQPLPWRRTVTPSKYAFVPAVVVEPKRIGKFTRGQWLGIAVVLGGALLSLAYLAVFFVQWLISLQPVADFLVTYPGSYDLPASAEPGFPWWAQWQHYFNILLMVLIIRS